MTADLRRQLAFLTRIPLGTYTLHRRPGGRWRSRDGSIEARGFVDRAGEITLRVRGPAWPDRNAPGFTMIFLQVAPTTFFHRGSWFSQEHAVIHAPQGAGSEEIELTLFRLEMAPDQQWRFFDLLQRIPADLALSIAAGWTR